VFVERWELNKSKLTVLYRHVLFFGVVVVRCPFSTHMFSFIGIRQIRPVGHVMNLGFRSLFEMLKLLIHVELIKSRCRLGKINDFAV
jgi:hypothetical protein